MKVFFALLALAAVLHALPSGKAPAKKMVCYFGSWAVYRPGNGKFDVETIDPHICTHVIFGFTGISTSGEIVVLDPYNELEEDWGRGALKRFVNLKLQNPNLKALIAIGGWNEGSEKYSRMAMTYDGRRRFINSVIPFMQRHNFDGFDLDWEYPANREGASPLDKQNFALLVREMRAEFNKYGYLLTAAVAAGQATIETAYDIPSIGRDFDFINVMCYDFHGAWETFTGHHAPLFPNPELDYGNNILLNLNHSINYWISHGAPREKLILGMGTYGRGFTLDNPSVNGLYAPASQAIEAGPCTREPGTWGYNEICERQLAQPGQWTVKEDPYYRSPYAYNGRLWIGYDTPESIAIKAQWAVDMGLGGGMVWSLETDDFLGICHGERFPLVKTIYRVLNGDYVPPTTTTADPSNPSPTTTPPPPTTTTQAPPVSDICQHEGYNRDPSGDCAIFYQCIRSGSSWTIYRMQCPPGTLFDINRRTCVHANTAVCA